MASPLSNLRLSMSVNSAGAGKDRRNQLILDRRSLAFIVFTI